MAIQSLESTIADAVLNEYLGLKEMDPERRECLCEQAFN